jgi:hypothetical protein
VLLSSLIDEMEETLDRRKNEVQHYLERLINCLLYDNTCTIHQDAVIRHMHHSSRYGHTSHAPFIKMRSHVTCSALQTFRLTRFNLLRSKIKMFLATGTDDHQTPVLWHMSFTQILMMFWVLSIHNILGQSQ